MFWGEGKREKSLAGSEERDEGNGEGLEEEELKCDGRGKKTVGRRGKGEGRGRMERGEGREAFRWKWGERTELERG